MNPEELSYALSKQLLAAHTLESNYGAVALDDEMQVAVERALRPILERRLASRPAGEVSSADYAYCDFCGKQAETRAFELGGDLPETGHWCRTCRNEWKDTVDAMPAAYGHIVVDGWGGNRNESASPGVQGGGT